DVCSSDLINLTIALRAVEIQQVAVHVAVRLLICSPINEVQRIVITLANPSPEHTQIKAFPVHIEIYPKTEALGGIADHREILGIAQCITFLNNAIAVQVFKFRPARHNLERTPGDNRRLIQSRDFFWTLEQAIVLQSPDFTQLHAFIVLGNYAVGVVKPRNMAPGIRQYQTCLESEGRPANGVTVTIAQ